MKEPFTIQKKVGFAFILTGVTGILWAPTAALARPRTLATCCFWVPPSAGLATPSRCAGLDGLHAAAISAVGSMLLFLPPYAFVSGTNLLNASWTDIALQALVQGVLTAVVSYVLYGHAVALLDASSGAALAASCPAMTALFAIPILGEWPSALDWIAIILISIGVYVVSGGPLPRQSVHRHPAAIH